MRRSIVGFEQDEVGDWVAHLSCLHRQHVRHALADSEGILVARPPGWWADVRSGEALLLLRDLVPPRGPGDDRLLRLAELIERRSLAGYELPPGLAIAVTTDPKDWESYRLEGFVQSADVAVVRWASRDSDELKAMLRSGSDDPLAYLDIAQVLGSDPA